MEDHPRVLQEGIEVGPFGGRREKTQEGVGGQEHEEEEPHADETHHARHARDHVGWEALRGKGHGRAPPTERHGPKENRAFVRTPGRGHLVVPREHRVGVVRHIEDREVRDVERIRQTGESDRAEKRIGRRGRACDRHERAVAPRGPDERQHALNDAQRKAQDECEVSELRNHLCYLRLK